METCKDIPRGGGGGRGSHRPHRKQRGHIKRKHYRAREGWFWQRLGAGAARFLDLIWISRVKKRRLGVAAWTIGPQSKVKGGFECSGGGNLSPGLGCQSGVGEGSFSSFVTRGRNGSESSGLRWITALEEIRRFCVIGITSTRTRTRSVHSLLQCSPFNVWFDFIAVLSIYPYV